MNNKGFTLIELITTFSLSAIIILLLINVVIIIKNIYFDYNIKTNLLITQANLSKSLNSKFKSNNLISYTSCSDTYFCYEFQFIDGTTSKLEVNSAAVILDNRVYNLDNNSTISNPTITKQFISTEDTTVNNAFLIIKIPITNKLYNNENFGINLIYPYNSNITSL